MSSSSTKSNSGLESCELSQMAARFAAHKPTRTTSFSERVIVFSTEGALARSPFRCIDTDSEPEILPPSVPRPQAPTPAVSQPDAPATAAPVTSIAPGSIQAVIVRCNVEKNRSAPWSATMIQADHPVFYNSVPPVPRLIEVPLVFHRVGTQSANRADLDNQIITYLNIDDESGLAPSEWSSHIGTVVVARKDKKSLLPQHLEGVWMYCDYILDLFGEGEGAPTRLYNKQAFEKWWKSYCKEQKEFRPGTGGENDPDDWRAVRSPYEM